MIALLQKAHIWLDHRHFKQQLCSYDSDFVSDGTYVEVFKIYKKTFLNGFLLEISLRMLLGRMRSFFLITVSPTFVTGDPYEAVPTYLVCMLIFILCDLCVLYTFQIGNLNISTVESCTNIQRLYHRPENLISALNSTIRIYKKELSECSPSPRDKT